MFLDIFEFKIENKIYFERTLFQKCGLKNLQEELVLSPESAKDCERFHKSETTFSK